MKQSTELKPIVDKLGFLKYATEQDYCKKHGLVKFYDLDWLEPETQYYMRLFIHTPKGEQWLKDHKGYIDGGYLQIE